MLECVDRECLCMEQEEAGIPFQSQAMVRVHYKGRPILLGFIMNFHAPRLKIGIRRFIVQNPFVHPLRLLVSFVVKNAVSHPVRPIQVQIGRPSTNSATRALILHSNPNHPCTHQLVGQSLIEID